MSMVVVSSPPFSQPNIALPLPFHFWKSLSLSHSKIFHFFFLFFSLFLLLFLSLSISLEIPKFLHASNFQISPFSAPSVTVFLCVSLFLDLLLRCVALCMLGCSSLSSTNCGSFGSQFLFISSSINSYFVLRYFRFRWCYFGARVCDDSDLWGSWNLRVFFFFNVFDCFPARS